MSKCKKKITYKSEFDFHVKTSHEKLQNHPKRYVEKHHQLCHTKSVHENLKPFCCQIRDQSFICKCSFELHTLTVHEKIKKVSKSNLV